MLRKHLRHPLIAGIAISLSFSISGHASEATSPDSTEASSDENAIQIQQELPLQDLRTFTEIFERIRSSYVEEVDDETLFNNAIKGMLNSLDPHSAYLQEEDFSDLQENTSGKFGGLGIEVGMENGLVRVITPIDDTPAERAGIRAGDLIVSLDGEAVMGLSLGDAVERMRGEPGTPITIEVRRKGEQELLSFTIERAEIKVASVRTEMLDSNIGYVRLTQFQENTGNELKSALQKWKETTELNGLILDMRNNPGGVLQAAVGVVDTFISEGLIVYTEGRSPLSDVRYHASSDTLMPDIPIVVLVNGGSASASEIVAGALQDHGRAVIVGTRSFGKGSVQTVLPVSDTAAVKLTTARYFTPDGRSIQAQGIAPDIVVEQSEVTPNEQRYYKESDLPGHLENPDGENTSSTADANDDDTNKSDDLISRDFQLYEAHTLLRGVAILAPAAKKPAKSEQ
ncbi:MAG: S41 family peptidase [Pseudomonadota bacterium]|nr:S41 family peptidase [Pseudomonadota bacterium]